MEYKERYKEVFSQIRPMKEFDPEEMYVKKPYKSITKKLVGIAAAVALLASLCLTAYAVNLFGLRDVLLPQKQEVKLPLEAGETEQEKQMVDAISLAGFASTPESQATAEWQAFLSTYDVDGAVLDSVGNDVFAPGTSYVYYQVYSQEMADKLDEITAKYDLKLHTDMLDDLFTDEALCDQVGGDFLGENRTAGSYMYEDGTFKFDGELDLEAYGHLDYQFQRCVRGSFTDVLLTLGDINIYTEWVYTTSSGVPAVLAIAPHKALVIVDLPDCFVTINVLAGTDTSADDIFSSGAFTVEDLERFADSFDLSILSPVRTPDPDLPRPTLDEALGKPSPDEFFRIAGIEEPEAQAFFAKLLQDIEDGNRQSVAETILYPAAVTTWKTSESGTYLVENTVESAEEFLPFYDDIFTESLWESIQMNRYNKERSDLIPNDGLVGAAGGNIWFCQAGIMTIQNDEGCSIRQSQSGISTGPVPVVETRYDSARTAYAAVLGTLLNERFLPDGSPYDPFMDGSGDQFAIVDLDGDGTEELILLAANSYTAGQAGYVLAWDENAGTTRMELVEYPSFTFYNNGYLQAWAAHNHGKAGDALWPYTLYQYNMETGTYQPVAMVDAWNRTLGETYYDAAFPEGTDRSGTGVVYYVMEPSDYDLSAPMDAADYNAWQLTWMDGAEKLEIPYQELTAENIAKLREGT